MKGSRAIGSLAAIVVLASAPLAAHTLAEGTARVSLRDGHLEVQAEWDLFLLAAATPTVIATEDDEALLAHHAALRRAVVSGTQLRVDGRPLALEATGFPAPAELRALAATLSAEGREHGALVRLRLESSAQAVAGREVHASFPPALGPVLATFVQPSTVYAPPGARAVFPVLALPTIPAAPADATPPAHSFAWGFGALGALAVTAFALEALRRKHA